MTRFRNVSKQELIASVMKLKVLIISERNFKSSKQKKDMINYIWKVKLMKPEQI